MALHTLTSLKALAGKRVLVRVDLNVPLKGREVADDSRLTAVVPTIRYLVKQRAKVILVSHLGRPEGKKVSSLSLAPVAEHLSNLLAHGVDFVPAYEGERVEKRVEGMQPGDVILLENIRFSPDEQRPKSPLAKQLAALADVFVLDGFAVAHRPDASVSQVAKYLPSYAGLLLEREITGLSRVMSHPTEPFVVVLGGVKTETKIPVMKHLLPNASVVLIGGAIFSTLLAVRGYGVGESVVDMTATDQMLTYGKNKKVITPVDVIVGTKTGKRVRQVMIQDVPHEICKKDEAILDIGPASIQLFSLAIKQARTLVWNGAMGYFELPVYAHGTLAVARLVAARSRGSAYGVVGGGETVEALRQVKMIEHVDLVSTGGGAMLEYLAGNKLPGILAVSE